APFFFRFCSILPVLWLQVARLTLKVSRSGDRRGPASRSGARDGGFLQRAKRAHARCQRTGDRARQVPLTLCRRSTPGPGQQPFPRSMEAREVTLKGIVVARKA